MPSQRRVLLVVRPAEGGIRQHILDLSRGLAQHGWEPSLAAPAAFLQALPELHSFATVQPLEIAVKTSPGDIAAAGSLRAMTSGYGLIHAHGLRAGIVAMLAQPKPPLIVSAHNLPGTGLLPKVTASAINHRCRAWIAVSGAIASGLEGLGATRIHEISNGVDLDAMSRIGDRLEARALWGVGKDEFVVGYVGRLSVEKGADILLDAAAKMPDTQFLVAGSGPEMENLKVAASSNVRMLGRVDDVRSVYAAADVVAIPSRSEGQGIVALEAMAAGVPIVATRVGGLLQTLTEGVTALLVPSEDVDALVQAVTRLRTNSDLSDQLRAEASRVVRERYAIQTMWRETAALYDAVTG